MKRWPWKSILKTLLCMALCGCASTEERRWDQEVRQGNITGAERLDLQNSLRSRHELERAK